MKVIKQDEFIFILRCEYLTLPLGNGCLEHLTNFYIFKQLILCSRIKKYGVAVIGESFKPGQVIFTRFK